MTGATKIIFIKEQNELLKERVKRLHIIDRRVKESARRIADEYKNLQTAKDARNKPAASHPSKQDLTASEHSQLGSLFQPLKSRNSSLTY